MKLTIDGLAICVFLSHQLCIENYIIKISNTKSKKTLFLNRHNKCKSVLPDKIQKKVKFVC